MRGQHIKVVRWVVCFFLYGTCSSVFANMCAISRLFFATAGGCLSPGELGSKAHQTTVVRRLDLNATTKLFHTNLLSGPSTRSQTTLPPPMSSTITIAPADLWREGAEEGCGLLAQHGIQTAQPRRSFFLRDPVPSTLGVR